MVHQQSWYEDPPSPFIRWNCFPNFPVIFFSASFTVDDDGAQLGWYEDPSSLSPLHASSSEWGVMRRFPLSPLLRIHNVNNVERCTATMQPLSTHIVVCRFAGTDRPTGNGNPTGRLRFRRLQLTQHFSGCFEPGLRKLRPMKWEMGVGGLTLQCKAIHLWWWW